jgi:hypothetical protein
MAENMGKLSNANSETLPEFQNYLVEKQLAAEKNVSFFAYWVSRFPGFARRQGIKVKWCRASMHLRQLN